MYAFFADLVTTVHLAIVAFMILGLPLILVGGACKWAWVRNPWFRITHLGIMGYIVFNALRGELCFLTHLEHDLREKAGQSMEGARDYSFIGRLFHDILFVEMPQEDLHRIYFAFGALVLIATLFVRPRFRRSVSS